MRKSKFTAGQIVAILKGGEAGVPMAEACRKHGISSPTCCARKRTYAGATVPDLALENAAIKDRADKNVRHRPRSGRWWRSW
jgi:hypothetical protein